MKFKLYDGKTSIYIIKKYLKLIINYNNLVINDLKTMNFI